MNQPLKQPRNSVASHGTFLSLPSVFEGAPGVKHAFKMQIEPVVSESRGSSNDSEVTFGAVS